MEKAADVLAKERENHSYQISSFNFLYEKVLVHKMGLRDFLDSTHTDKSHVSKIPVANLELKSLVDLPVNSHAKGCYLLLRTIIKPIWNIAYLTTFVEDHVGSVVLMNLYNSVYRELEDNPCEAFPLGIILILKEPTMRTLRPGFALHCTNPSDIIIVGKHSVHYDKVKDIEWKTELPSTSVRGNKPRTANEWKTWGNKLCLESRFVEALESYFVAMNLFVPGSSDKQYIDLHLTMGATYLRLGFFEPALHSAQLVLTKQYTNKKALQLAGKACYELRRFRDAEQYYTHLMSVELSSKEAVSQYNRCLKRLEETKGKVDIVKLYKDSLSHPSEPADCADYMAKLNLAYIHNKGRRLIANEDIPSGTLLVISKAMVAIWFSPSEIQAMARDAGCSVEEVKRDKIVTYFTNLVMKNPNTFGKNFGTMCLKDKTLGKKPPKMFCDGNAKQEVTVNTWLIKLIVDKNAFIDTRDIMDRDKSGLYYLPYFMARSCIANVSWNTFRDVIIVHAVRPIHVGEEIVATPYANRLNSDVYTQRLTYFNHYIFECECELCKLDAKEPAEVHHQRLKYYDLYQKVYAQLRNGFSEENLERLRGLISDIQRTYELSGRKKFQLALFHPFVSYASVLLQQRRYEGVLEAFDRALGVLGLSIGGLQECAEYSDEGIIFPRSTYITSRFILIADLICTYYEYKKDQSNASVWYKYFKKLDKHFTGCTLYNDSAEQRKRHR